MSEQIGDKQTSVTKSRVGRTLFVGEDSKGNPVRAEITQAIPGHVISQSKAKGKALEQILELKEKRRSGTTENFR